MTDTGKRILPLLDDTALENIAQRFKALSEPSRLKVLKALIHGEASVTRILEMTGLNQANASRHLNYLYREKILTRTKQGTTVIYRVSDPVVYELCWIVCSNGDKNHP